MPCTKIRILDRHLFPIGRGGAAILFVLALMHFGACQTSAQAPAPFTTTDENDRLRVMHEHAFNFVEALNGNYTILQASQFTEAALAAVPVANLHVQMDIFNKRSGGFDFLGQNQVDETHFRVWLRGNAGEFLDLDMDLIIEVEAEFPYRVNDINFAPAHRLGDPLFSDWSEVDAALAKLDFDVAATVLELAPDANEPRTLLTRRGDTRVPIGPAASLYLMQELVDAIRSGDKAWSHQLVISDDLKSPPASEVGRIFEGGTLELSDMAQSLMQFTDNSSFDHLVHDLGRAKLTRRLWASIGAENDDARALSPFLTTRELFTLKCQPEVAFLRRYAEAEPAEQWALLEGTVKGTPVVMELFHSWEVPRSPDKVGWFGTTDALAGVMSDLWRARLEPEMAILGEIMAAPRRIPWDRRVWTEFWFELQGEPGAMTGVWAMERRRDGRQFVVAVVANSQTQSLYDAFSNDAILGVIDLLEHLP